MSSRILRWILPLVAVAFGLFLSACRTPDVVWKLPEDQFTTNSAYLGSFTTTCTIAERADSYCLTIKLLQRQGSNFDLLSYPEICVPKMDRGEQIRSLWYSTPSPMDKPLPFHNEPLPAGESGTEVRMRIGENRLVTYSILYREVGDKREHRWTGSDSLPSLDK